MSLHAPRSDTSLTLMISESRSRLRAGLRALSQYVVKDLFVQT